MHSLHEEWLWNTPLFILASPLPPSPARRPRAWLINARPPVVNTLASAGILLSLSNAAAAATAAAPGLPSAAFQRPELFSFMAHPEFENPSGVDSQEHWLQAMPCQSVRWCVCAILGGGGRRSLAQLVSVSVNRDFAFHTRECQSLPPKRNWKPGMTKGNY